MTNTATETVLPSRVTMYFPQRPYTLVDGINRMGLATGSLRGAMAGSSADYNGHRVRVMEAVPRVEVARNYKGSFSAHYTWAGIVWLIRSVDFVTALEVAEEQYARGAKGAETHVECYTTEQVEICKARGYVTKEENDALTAQWRDARYDEINNAFSLERQLGVPGTALLAQSATAAEFKSKVDAFIAERRNARKTA